MERERIPVHHRLYDFSNFRRVRSPGSKGLIQMAEIQLISGLTLDSTVK